MAAKENGLPETMTAPETGEAPTRRVRPFVLCYKGEIVTVDLPGYYPAGEGEGVHVGNVMAAVEEAPRAPKGEADPVGAWTPLALGLSLGSASSPRSSS